MKQSTEDALRRIKAEADALIDAEIDLEGGVDIEVVKAVAHIHDALEQTLPLAIDPELKKAWSEQVSALVQKIEAMGASTELTNLVSLASGLGQAIVNQVPVWGSHDWWKKAKREG